MQMKSEFDSLVERMGLGEDERALAEIFWKRAEKAVQGKPTQEALLLGGEPVNFETRSAVILYNIETLTNQEIDFMVWLNRGTLNGIEEMKMFLKRNIDVEWTRANPEDPMTQGNFEMMNNMKDMLRKLKRQTNMLSSIQRKLKKAKGSC
jgi:hypothetical protein